MMCLRLATGARAVEADALNPPACSVASAASRGACPSEERCSPVGVRRMGL